MKKLFSNKTAATKRRWAAVRGVGGEREAPRRPQQQGANVSQGGVRQSMQKDSELQTIRHHPLPDIK